MTRRVDLDELERKARAAAPARPARWFPTPGNPMRVSWSPTIDGNDTCVPQSYADCYRWADAEYVAAASPDVTLALVARIRELESELRGCADAFAGVTDDPDPYDVMAVVEKGTVIP